MFIQHTILGFQLPGSNSNSIDYVVDMSSMQFGDAERGTYGEQYFLGSLAGFENATVEHGGGIKLVASDSNMIQYSDRFTEISKECAQRVWNRWQNRDKEGWCEYCGVGGILLECAPCKQACVNVRYVLSSQPSIL